MRGMTAASLIVSMVGALGAITIPKANSQSPGASQDQVLIPRGNELPSFDCAKARTAPARLICADRELARLDGELGGAFQRRKAQIASFDQPKFFAEQLAWIRERNARCGLTGRNDAPIEALASSKPCMMSAIGERIAFLDQTLNVQVNTVTPSQVAFGNLGETYEQDRAWEDQINHGACTHLHDRRTDSPEDLAECNRDYAMEPMCVSYKGFASGWYDMANDPNSPPTPSDFSIDNVNALFSKSSPTDPPYDRSPQFRDVLLQLMRVTFSSARTKWSTRDQFANYAYKICMEGHPFSLVDLPKAINGAGAPIAAPPSSLAVPVSPPTESWTQITSLTEYAKQIKHQWVKYDNGYLQTSYIDLASVIREGDTVTVLDLQNWNPRMEVGTTGEWLGSGLSLVRYDCGSTPRSMIVAGVDFHGNMGSGSPQSGAADIPKEPSEGWHVMQVGVNDAMIKARDMVCNTAPQLAAALPAAPAPATGPPSSPTSSPPSSGSAITNDLYVPSSVLDKWNVGAPIEHRDDPKGETGIQSDITEETLREMVALTRESGFMCNSVSHTRPWAFQRGFTLICDQFAHKYDISDEGGTWVVKVSHSIW